MLTNWLCYKDNDFKKLSIISIVINTGIDPYKNQQLLDIYVNNVCVKKTLYDIIAL